MFFCDELVIFVVLVVLVALVVLLILLVLVVSGVEHVDGIIFCTAPQCVIRERETEGCVCKRMFFLLLAPGSPAEKFAVILNLGIWKAVL
jgi:hypothetical protein